MHRKDGVLRSAIFLAFMLILGSYIPVCCFGDTHLGTTGTYSNLIQESAPIAGTPHSPIVIDGDLNFSDTALAEGWTGDGSPGDPFIIDGLDIDRGDSAGHCISIRNTRVSFTISGCTLIGANVSPGAGIYLNNVWNARVVDNLCQHNTHGVLAEGMSEDCVLINNTCTHNAVSGIQLDGSRNMTLSSNTCSGNYHGINAIVDPDVYHESRDHVITDNICCSNSYGISIGHFNPESLGPVLLLVIDNNCSANSEDGIRIINPGYSTFINNSCNRNGAAGIRLRVDNIGNNVVENTFSENGQFGIYLDQITWLNNFTDNLCSVNGQYGIYISEFSGMNNLRWNAFGHNLVGNALDAGSENVFDHNYWSDYSGMDENSDGVGDTAYISGVIIDYHPLMFAPTRPSWIETPKDQTIEFGTHFIYDLNATAPAPIFWSVIWDSWTAQFTIDGQGMLESIGPLSLGDYELQVTVTNLYGFSILARFEVNVVSVLDTTAPNWVVTPMDLTIDFGEGVDLVIHALDRSGIARWTINDTDHFSLNATYYDLGSTVRITNNLVLEPASYVLNITVYDPFDNSCSAKLVVTVLEVPIITTTTTASTSIMVDKMDPLLALGLGAGIGGAIVIAIVVVLLRRKS